jgi:hypothetical protein
MNDFDSDLKAPWLRENFAYDKETGRFERLWPVLTYRGGIRYAEGTLTGSVHADGYRYMCIKGRLFLEHRLAYLWMSGSWPEYEVDHRDGDRSNNAWSNLRHATVSENRQNNPGQHSRLGPHRGVYRLKGNRKEFAAQIKVKGEAIYLGCFDDLDEAIAARVEAEKRYFGTFGAWARGAA